MIEETRCPHCDGDLTPIMESVSELLENQLRVIGSVASDIVYGVIQRLGHDGGAGGAEQGTSDPDHKHVYFIGADNCATCGQPADNTPSKSIPNDSHPYDIGFDGSCKACGTFHDRDDPAEPVR